MKVILLVVSICFNMFQYDSICFNVSLHVDEIMIIVGDSTTALWQELYIYPLILGVEGTTPKGKTHPPPVLFQSLLQPLKRLGAWDFPPSFSVQTPSYCCWCWFLPSVHGWTICSTNILVGKESLAQHQANSTSSLWLFHVVSWCQSQVLRDGSQVSYSYCV